MIRRYALPAVVSLGLIGSALLSKLWLHPLLEFFRLESAMLEGAAASVQLVLWVVGVVLKPWQFWLERLERVNAEKARIAEREAALAAERAQEEAARAAEASQRRRYLAFLAELYRYLDFRGMGADDRLALRLPLLETYVPLTARPRLPEGETWDRRAELAGRVMTAEELEAARPGASVPLLTLLAKHSGLVVLGDPGSGKSTFLKYLALLLAGGRGAEVGLAGRVPYLLPLSALAEALASSPQPLTACFGAHYRERNLGFDLEPQLVASLAAGEALVLLDGLDEVKDPTLRGSVVSRVRDFYAAHRAAGNKFVVTSRVIGYLEHRLDAEGLGEGTLVDFDAEDRKVFIEQWTAAVERAASDSPVLANAAAARERGELLAAIEANAGVRRLASNPLLLTILALMKRQGMVLPHRRAELYERYVKVLVSTWNRARSLSGNPGPVLEVEGTLKVLAPLALWMQRTVPGAGLVRAEALQAELTRLFEADTRLLGAQPGTPEEAAKAFLESVRGQTGLLLARGEGHFGFLHLIFQEWLAAVGLVEGRERDEEGLLAALAARVGEPSWNEVLLLALEHMALNLKQEQLTSALLARLIEEAPGPDGAAVLLGGQVAWEVGPLAVTQDCRAGVVQALLETLRGERPGMAPVRARAGELLAELGDPRPEVMTLDAMQLCWVPAGRFVMGSEEHEWEQPQHEVEIPYDYWLARYPVTVAQWREYVAASGVGVENEHSLRGALTAPVVLITWHEALALCRWLTERWRERGLLPAGWSVQLPSEAEWEKAARGGLELPAEPRVRRVSEIEAVDLFEAGQANAEPARCFPWGDEEDPERANYRDSGVRRVSAVGAFARGRGPYGCEELAGNAWEWTRSHWGEDGKEPLPYPYVPGGSREGLAAGDEVFRVLRGGSYFYDPAGWVRCSARFRLYPGAHDDNYGFRVLVCPFSP